MGHGARIATGLGLAAAAQFLSFLLAGAGHGFVAPLFLTVALWFLIPLALLVSWRATSAARPVTILLIVVALAADGLLANRMLAEQDALRLYVDVNGAIGVVIIGLWLSLWFFWQAILLHSLIAARGRADVAD